MKKLNDVVIYVDRKGVAHNALVLQPDTDEIISLIYVTADGVAKTEFGVHHKSSDAKRENNPNVPEYILNCWKEKDEDHPAIPVDHPMFDHPFELKTKDEAGRVIQKPRPLTQAAIDEHVAHLGATETAPEPETTKEFTVDFFPPEMLVPVIPGKSFEIGDKVFLKSGSPTMKIIDIRPVHGGGNTMECEWNSTEGEAYGKQILPEGTATGGQLSGHQQTPPADDAGKGSASAEENKEDEGKKETVN